MKGTGGASVGKTKLNKERLKVCQREIEQIGHSAKSMKMTINLNNLKDKMKTAYQFLNALRDLKEDVSCPSFSTQSTKQF